MQAKDSGMGHFTLFLPRGIGAGAQGKPGVVVSQNGKTVLTSTPFCRAVVAKVGLRSWNMSALGPCFKFIYRGYHSVRVLFVLLDEQFHGSLWDGHLPDGVLRFGVGQLQGAVRVTDVLPAHRNCPALDVHMSNRRAASSPFRRASSKSK